MAEHPQIHDLQEIEAIRQLKARYVRFGDTKQWDKLDELFIDDYEASFEGMPRMSKTDPTSGSVKGRENFVKLFSMMLTGVTTIHRIYASEITITGPNTATGIWSVHDTLYFPTCIFNGWGHYHEHYVKIGASWKLSKTQVTRLHTEEQWL